MLASPLFTDQLDLQQLAIPLVFASSRGEVLRLTHVAHDLLKSMGLQADRLPDQLWTRLEAEPDKRKIHWIVGEKCIECVRYRAQDGSFLLLLHEISEQHRTQVERVHRHRLEAIGRLAASVAHDLRAPLSTIVLNSRALESHVPLEEGPCQQLLSELQDASSRLRIAIAHVLDAAHAGPRIATKVSLRAICERVAGYVRADVRQRHHQLKLAIGTDVEVEANPIAFEHIVSSLVMNAIEASESPTEIQLETMLVERSQVEPTRVQGQQIALIRVRDSGPGVPADLRELVFQPAFSTKAEGSGLGLTLARDFARERNGDLILESSASGASFVVLLPLGNTSS